MTQEKTTLTQEDTSSERVTSSQEEEVPTQKVHPSVAEISRLTQDREERMKQRAQDLEQERQWRQKRTPGTGVLSDVAYSTPAETAAPKPKQVRRPKDPRLDRERPLYRDYDRDKEDTWQGGMVEVKEMFQDRMVQVAIGAIVFAFLVIALLLIVVPA